jgi:protein-L-isoaspartate(D-aspartate) O-methyltransferase
VTALLAELASQVFSIERHAALAAGAEGVLARLAYTNVTVIVGDGRQGFPEGSPFDAIIVSAAAAEVPPALLAQLAEGGRMIIPVGPSDTQQLQLIRKQNGQVSTTFYDLCRFVPLVADAVK